MQRIIREETGAIELFAAQPAEKYGVNFDYRLFNDGVFVSKNDVFAVIKPDMAAIEIDIAMRRFTQKVKHLNDAENGGRRQAEPKIKNDIAAAALLGTAASVSGAGIASGGSAVAGSVLWGGLAAVPVAPALLTAGLIGGGLYFGRQRLKQAYDKFVPQEHKDKIEGFIGAQMDNAVAGAQKGLVKAQKYLEGTKRKKDE